MTEKQKKYYMGFAYLASILIANLFVIWFGVIKLMALEIHSPDKVYDLITFPAGVVFIGLTFSLRDFVQRQWGDWACWIWMLIASALTTLLSMKVAVASFTAFIVSEGVDWLAFKYLGMTLKRRIVISNIFSCPLDSALFVTIAFGWYWPAIWGQALIKYASGLLVLPFIKEEKKQDRKMTVDLGKSLGLEQPRSGKVSTK